tara:strand:+ start:611 stop:10615 length:10005 start_codon:yes stop_codon:yes gene_type:complete
MGGAAAGLLYPLVIIFWLFLSIIRLGDDVPPAALLADFVVNVQRLGVAFERCIAGGLDLTPCSPSVARARIKRVGLKLAVGDAVPFTAVLADLYPCEPSPPIGGVVQPNAVPAEAAVATYIWMVAGDGTLEPLADAEPILLPRIMPNERVAGCGFDFYFTAAVAASQVGMPAALVAALPLEDRSRATIDFIVSRAPDPILINLLNQGPARMAHLRRLTSLELLDATNVEVALPHLRVFSLVIEPGGTSGVEALRMAGVVIREVLGSSAGGASVETIVQADQAISFLGPRMARADVAGLPSSDRLPLLLREFQTAKARESSSGGPAGGAGGAGHQAAGEDDGTASGSSTGYPKAFNLSLRAKLPSAGFGQVELMLSQLQLGAPAGPGGFPAAVPPAHPFTMITAIHRSREIIFFHALTGRKTMLPGVPMVEYISTELQQHCPLWLGDLCCRAILPPGATVQVPPSLDAEWNQIKAGNLLLDWETLECRIRAWAISEEATFDTVPPEARWTSRSRLTSMARIVPPILDELGFPSPAGQPNTPADVLNLACTYTDEAKGLTQSIVMAKTKTAIEAIFHETSRRFRSDLNANDPIRTIAGQFVISDSSSALSLITARQELPETNSLSRKLAMIPGQSGVLTHVSAEDLTAAKGVPATKAGPGTEDQAAKDRKATTEKKAADDKKAADEARKEAAKKAKVGSKANYLVERHADGKHVLLGPKSKGDERDIVSIAEFEKVTPKGACLPCWCSKHPFPWVACDQKDHPQHATQTGGAHAVRTNFKTQTLPSLLVTAAMLSPVASARIGTPMPGHATFAPVPAGSGEMALGPPAAQPAFRLSSTPAPSSDLPATSRASKVWFSTVSPDDCVLLYSFERADSAPQRPQLDTFGGVMSVADGGQAAACARREVSEECDLPLPWLRAMASALHSHPEGHHLVDFVHRRFNRAWHQAMWIVPIPYAASRVTPQLKADGIIEARADTCTWRVASAVVSNIAAFPSFKPIADALSTVVPRARTLTPSERHCGGEFSSQVEQDGASPLPILASAALLPPPSHRVDLASLDGIDLWQPVGGPLSTLGFKEPWLEAISLHSKTAEARLATDPQSKGLVAGQLVIGCSKFRRVLMWVDEVTVFDGGIGAAWSMHGTRLIPEMCATVSSAAQAVELYQSMYRKPISGLRKDGTVWHLPVRILTVRSLLHSPAKAKAPRQSAGGRQEALAGITSLVEARVADLQAKELAPGLRLAALVEALSMGVTDGTEPILSHAVSRPANFLEEEGVAPEGLATDPGWAYSGAAFTTDPNFRRDGLATPAETRALVLLHVASGSCAPRFDLTADAHHAGMIRVPRPAYPSSQMPRPLRGLHLCSGPQPSGLKRELGQFGIELEEYDNIYGPSGDVEVDDTYESLVTKCDGAHFGFFVMGPPCSPVSVSRLYNTHPGPPVLFSLKGNAADGLPPRKIPFAHRLDQSTAVAVYRRCCQLGEKILANGGLGFTEHPPPRSSEHFLGGRLWDKSGVTAHHASWWDMSWTKAMCEAGNFYSLTLAYCGLKQVQLPRQVSQVYRTLAFSPELDGGEEGLGRLAKAICTHPASFHLKTGGRDGRGEWRTARLARWPPELYVPLARSLATALGAAATPPAARRVHPLGVPIVEMPVQVAAIVLFPICFDGSEPRVGMPGGSASSAIGTLTRRENRDSCASRAQTWADALFAPRTDVYAYYQVTLDAGEPGELLVVGALISSPPPADLAAGRVDSVADLAAHCGVGLAWTSIAVLTGDLYVAAAAVVQNLAEFSGATPEIQQLRVTRGAMELAPVVMPQGAIRTCATPIPWCEVCEESERVVREVAEELRRVASLESTTPDLRIELHGWLDVCLPPKLEQISPALRQSCYKADDPRLRDIPYPSHAVPVPTEPLAPLPAAPDQRLIPPWATSLSRHALTPDTARDLRRARVRLHERLLWSWQHGNDMTGAPEPIFFAFGLEGYRPWAAKLVSMGHVLVQHSPTVIRLRDHSETPATHWNRDYLGSFLRNSVDRSLYDSVMTHGFTHLADREPITYVQDHLLSMYQRGLASLHQEIGRLGRLKRYELQVMPVDSVDIVGQLPTVFGANGSVPRPSDPSRDRRIVDSKAPRKRRLTFDKKHVVVSVGASCGWDESKRLHRESAPRPGWLRHSPAFRRQPLSALLSGPAPRLVATSKTPSQVKEMAVAAGASGAKLESIVAEHAARPRHAPELKWMFLDLMLVIVVMGHAAWLLGEPLVGFEDDEADCFFQFALMILARRDANIALLDPAAIERGDHEADLCNVLELVESMGVPPVSCWAQRLNTELGEEYERLCEERDRDVVQALANSNVQFGKWLEFRRALSAQTGRSECRLSKSLWYSDDPICLAVGVARVVRDVVTHTNHLGPRGARITMGKPIKRRISVDFGWIGGRCLTTGNLAYITDAKQMKALNSIRAALARELCFEYYEKLLGFLNHLVCLLGMAYEVMYGCYEVLDAARAAALSGSDMAPITPNAERSLQRWETAVNTRAGNSTLVAAFDTTSAPSGIAVRRMFSDAANSAKKHGDGEIPALAGNLYRERWVRPLSEAELIVPIVGLEMVAAMFNLIIFHSRLVGPNRAPTAMIIDSLAVPIIITTRASSQSKVSQWLHVELLKLDEYIAVADFLCAGHLYGPRNMIMDAGSRGRIKEMDALMRHLGMEPIEVSVTAKCEDLLARLVAYVRTLKPNERHCGGEFSSQVEKDGASQPPRFIQSARPVGTSAAAVQTTVRAPPPPSVAEEEHAARPLSLTVRAPPPAAEQEAWVAPPLPTPFMRCAPRAPAQHLPGPQVAPRTMFRASVPMACAATCSLPAPSASTASTSRAPALSLSVAHSPQSVEAALGRGRILEELSAFDIGPMSLTPIAAAHECTALARLTDALSVPSGPMALRPHDPSMLTAMAGTMSQYLERSYAPSTRKQDAAFMRRWNAICAYFNTPALRTDAAANSGADPSGHLVELVLQAFVLLVVYVNMEPRSHRDAAVGPDPQSAMNVVRGVHRYHAARGITMASPTMASRVLTGLMRTYVENCGIREIRREKPLTNAMINGCLATPDGSSMHGITVVHGSYAWQATKAWFSGGAEDGKRKDEIAKKSKATKFVRGRLTFKSVVWKISACGGEVPAPTAAQLALLDEASMDGYYLVHGRAKNDFFGIFFSPTPSFHPYSASSPRNAAREMRDLEIMALDAGLTAEMRADTPLFGGSLGEEFTFWEVETYFEIMMIMGAGVNPLDLRDYSIHSLRIFVACALMAADVPRHTIKRLLRWRSDISLEIYARLNDSEWATHVGQIYAAHVDSTIAGRLAALGTIDLESAARRLGAAAA